nr:NB-ARC domains-containing protein [Tanacetum cinerariifolium]
MKVLVDKSLITISSDMSVQMHGLIQAMAMGIVREESIMPGKRIRLWNLSEVYDLLSGKKVEITAAVEVLVLFLKKSSEKVHIDATGFAHLKKLRILKIYQSHKYLQEFELKNYNVKFSGSLYFLSNELSGEWFGSSSSKETNNLNKKKRKRDSAQSVLRRSCKRLHQTSLVGQNFVGDFEEKGRKLLPFTRRREIREYSRKSVEGVSGRHKNNNNESGNKRACFGATRTKPGSQNFDCDSRKNSGQQEGRGTLI